MAEFLEPKYEACEVLPDCLCNLELPHTAEHAHCLPRQVMPMLRFPSEEKEEDAKKKRVQDLLSDFNASRSDDKKLKEKFERRAEELMKELKAEEPQYTWLPREDGPVENSGDRLKYELEQSRFQLAEIRNQMHSLKRELTLYRKLVRQEVGGCYDLHHLMMDKNWKGRAEEIERLKSEIAQLESKAYGHKYLRNPITIPQYNPRFPRIDDLIPKTQAAVLKREVIKRKEDAESKQVSTFMKEYGNLALMYKASSTHNKILAEELRSLKEQLNQHEAKAKDDLELIKNLTAHQMQMRQMVEREAHLATLVDRKQDEASDSATEEKFDAEKYKTLWETSEYQKQSLYEMVRVLTERLNDVMKKADEAGKHCQENQEKKCELEEQLEVQKEARLASAKADKKPKAKKTVAGGKTLPVAEQLEAVKEENKFLKNFLRRAIDAKEEDLRLYKFTMKSIREQYFEALEKIKRMKEEQEQAVPTQK
ncbi:Coiled-coil domain-containing protein 13 [Argiope bruennichi]|uniref:Coiled-coil domain-containing protein 13 n=1 Tax=Argiope bruennichi TaxID=94029 RepID=A0A8T0EGL1_ARGBR|nr:Coiled-coil domain-containing protein 13 [Argiope bruennichi]